MNPNILAIHGSPRRQGNTSTLLKRAVEGAMSMGANVEEITLRDLKMSPCLEIYGCKEQGRCVIRDDFQMVYDKLIKCDGLMLASPIFFYTVSAHTKIFMDRCQSLWVKKYWLASETAAAPNFENNPKKALFISVGATRGKKLFEGTLLTVRYFLDTLDMQLWRSLLYRGLDGAGEVLGFPEYLDEAYNSGADLCRALKQK
ncbi:flavodoxin family protein [Desulfomonile tiedjei]|uniref:Multimeric flavodoxin WrbA n=1 Tax=Desulfomonile tiedjei (strain ATCC 49306 / DSM 6799 / DCB-1) TaxID=706587 RepID=I4CCJ4_DESTA|nr:flavodoxin family protein [Desulfomonile tiedjei]AFM27285.1 multimeric flavodoxin WrbA [Desulfomonile tiedjei DSM 6799]